MLQIYLDGASDFIEDSCISLAARELTATGADVSSENDSEGHVLKKNKEKIFSEIGVDISLHCFYKIYKPIKKTNFN